jgi:Txe/YoeB family toxin of Txe-Axe toxin-antitoxin module
LRRGNAVLMSDEHRLVYLVTEKEVVVLQARYHY